MASTSKNRRSEGTKHQKFTAAAMSPLETTSKSRQSPLPAGTGLKRHSSAYMYRSSSLYIEINICLEVVLVFLPVSNQYLSFAAKVDANAILPVS